MGGLPAEGAGAADRPQRDPGSLTGLRRNVGESFLFEVVGNLVGSVYGTDIYTDDSRLATAVVHAGLVEAGQKAVVRVTMLPGQPAYKGSNGYGVSSSGYGSWVGSFRVELIEAVDAPRAAEARVEVEWLGTWYRAEVLMEKGGKYFIKYVGYGDNWNEWVGRDRIRFVKRK